MKAITTFNHKTSTVPSKHVSPLCSYVRVIAVTTPRTDMIWAMRSIIWTIWPWRTQPRKISPSMKAIPPPCVIVLLNLSMNSNVSPAWGRRWKIEKLLRLSEGCQLIFCDRGGKKANFVIVAILHVIWSIENQPIHEIDCKLHRRVDHDVIQLQRFYWPNKRQCGCDIQNNGVKTPKNRRNIDILVGDRGQIWPSSGPYEKPAWVSIRRIRRAGDGAIHATGRPSAELSSTKQQHHWETKTSKHFKGLLGSLEPRSW